MAFAVTVVTIDPEPGAAWPLKFRELYLCPSGEGRYNRPASSHSHTTQPNLKHHHDATLPSAPSTKRRGGRAAARPITLRRRSTRGARPFALSHGARPRPALRDLAGRIPSLRAAANPTLATVWFAPSFRTAFSIRPPDRGAAGSSASYGRSSGTIRRRISRTT